jgi:hypothetical protein
MSIKKKLSYMGAKEREALLKEEIKALELQIKYTLKDLRVIGENVNELSIKKHISTLIKEKSQYEEQLNYLFIEKNVKYAIENNKLEEALQEKTMKELCSELSQKYQFSVGVKLTKAVWACE